MIFFWLWAKFCVSRPLTLVNIPIIKPDSPPVYTSLATNTFYSVVRLGNNDVRVKILKIFPFYDIRQNNIKVVKTQKGKVNFSYLPSPF